LRGVKYRLSPLQAEEKKHFFVHDDKSCDGDFQGKSLFVIDSNHFAIIRSHFELQIPRDARGFDTFLRIFFPSSVYERPYAVLSSFPRFRRGKNPPKST
jgi:hypothetical protein